MDKQTFMSKEDISWKVISILLDELAPLQKPYAKNIGVFIRNADILKSKKEVVRKLKTEVLYQEEIALKTIRLFGGPQKEHIHDFFWGVEISDAGSSTKGNMLEINLHLVSNDDTLGHILFPAKAIKLSDFTFRVWETASIDEAIDVVAQLSSS